MHANLLPWLRGNSRGGPCHAGATSTQIQSLLMDRLLALCHFSSPSLPAQNHELSYLTWSRIACYCIRNWQVLNLQLTSKSIRELQPNCCLKESVPVQNKISLTQLFPIDGLSPGKDISNVTLSLLYTLKKCWAKNKHKLG